MYFIASKKNYEVSFQACSLAEIEALALSKAKVVSCIDDWYAADEARIVICGQVVVPKISITMHGEKLEWPL